MFDRHRQRAVVLLAAADIALTILSFEAAYQTRVYLPLEQVFSLPTAVKALLLGFVLLLWTALRARRLPLSHSQGASG